MDKDKTVAEKGKAITRPKWYGRTWFVVLGLLFFAPLGIFLAWKYSGWTKKAKILATVLTSAFFIYAIVSGYNAAPVITVDNVKDQRIQTEDASYRITGTITGASSTTTLTVNDKPTQINGTTYSSIVELSEGDNSVIIVAKKGDKVASETVIIYRVTAEELAKKKAEAEAKNAEREVATASKKATEDKKAADAAAAQQQVAQQQAAAEAERNKPKTTFSDGTFLVGKDIAAGTYRTDGSSNCYYERLSSTSGGFDSIIANDNPRGQVVITVAVSDAAFKSQRCGTWSLVQ